MKELLRKKEALKNRVSALRRVFDQKREELLEAEAEFRDAVDAITQAETKQRNDAAREKASRQSKKEWVVTK